MSSASEGTIELTAPDGQIVDVYTKVTIKGITPPPPPPPSGAKITAHDLTVVAAGDSVTDIMMQAEDTDPAAKVITYTIEKPPVNGALSVTRFNNRVSYTPNANVSVDNFTYFATDDVGNKSNIATVNIAISSVTPPQPPQHNIGVDGVLQILPTNGAELYLMDNPDKTKFNVSYGTGSHLPYTKKTEGSLTYFNTTGNPITYHSHSTPGRSVRLDFYTDDSIWNDKTPYDWQNNPGYLLEAAPKCIESGEYTIYLRPHGPLGSQQSCAWKLGGRDEDNKRSLFEICAADSLTHKNPFAHWDFLHFPYVACPVKLIGNHSALAPEKWYGVKAIRIVDPSKKFCDFYLFEDPNPFDSSGKPLNNWRLIGWAHDAGTSGYKNIPTTWASQKDLMRVDGFQSVDFALGSVRRVDINATPAIPFKQQLSLMVVHEEVDPEDKSLWIENPFDAIEESQPQSTDDQQEEGFIRKLVEGAKSVIGQ